ncbi:uncharacterized protein VP01_11g7 [Puccinia sorghi]|uniref:Uncharacterized protein n=1 Tax=Puccinia sorghi TaxID=27349 RepID=A0A0L6VQM0_9BASI|nr:uncharacterized protein VP01_11g7 [Puccinia sorghi]
MPSIKGKMRKEEDSDSDESFHCCGRPQDLIDDAQDLLAKTEPDANAVHVPDNQEYYLYSAGLERMHSPQSPPRNASQPLSPLSSHGFQRTPTVYSSDSDCTRIGSPPLIIKTGGFIVPYSMPEMNDLRVRFVEPTKPLLEHTTPAKRPKWKLKIPRPLSFSRMVLSPTDESLKSPPMPEAQAPAFHTAPPIRASRRRQGMVFNLHNLPNELKEMAENNGSSDGSGT